MTPGFVSIILMGKSEKSHLLCTRNLNKIGGISNSKCENLLDIHTDNKLIFKSHVRSLCKKASWKLNSFARNACALKFDH